MKKCASLLGVGLHLYAERPIRTGAAARPQRVDEKLTPASAARAQAAAGKLATNAGSTNGAVTPRQLDAISKVARAKGLDPGAVESMSLRVFNRKPEALSQAEAARLIKELSNLKRQAA